MHRDGNDQLALFADERPPSGNDRDAAPDPDVPEDRLLGPERDLDSMPDALNWSTTGYEVERRRQIMVDLLETSASRLSAREIRKAARRLGLTARTDIQEYTPEEQSLIFESCLVTEVWFGIDGASDLNIENLPPPVDDEDVIGEAMSNARPSVWEIVERVPGHGLLVRDALGAVEGVVALADDQASHVLASTAGFYARLADFDSYAMAVDSIVPIESTVHERIDDALSEGDPTRVLTAQEFADICMRAYLSAPREGGLLRQAPPVWSKACKTADRPHGIPSHLTERFDEIVLLTDATCREHLDREYAELCREMAAKLCRKRPSPLERSRMRSWAAGIPYVLGQVNDLFTPTNRLHVQAKDLCEAVGVNPSTGARMAAEIREALTIRVFDPTWTHSHTLKHSLKLKAAMVVEALTGKRRVPKETMERVKELGLL